MGRPAIYSKEELRERRNIEKSLYMKARTKLNFVFENEDAIVYKELAKDEELSLATVIKNALDRKIVENAEKRKMSIEKYKAYLDETYRGDVIKAGTHRGAISSEERIARQNLN